VAIDVKSVETGTVGGGAGPAVERVRANASVSTAGPQTSQAATGDSIHITDAARALAQLQIRVAATPDIDTSRVAQLRQAIGLGQYQPNTQRIAGRILQLESDIAAATLPKSA
jgi:negative regulator of flagellin synthesis FlgM